MLTMKNQSLDTKIELTHNDIFGLITDFERNYNVDKITLDDGTKIWNLLRVYLYNYQYVKMNFKKQSKSDLFHNLKYSILPLSIPYKKTKICAFSTYRVRRYNGRCYYNRYIDPLYDLINDDITVFEWPHTGKKFLIDKTKICSINYQRIHLSLFTKTFWNILFYRIYKKINFSINNQEILIKILNDFSNKVNIDNNKLKNDVYEHIVFFRYMKKFFIKFISRTNPSAVFMICGYGSRHMALSQVCKEKRIPSIELQHGLLVEHSPFYFKNINSENRDCIPEYLLTFGDIFSNIAKKGGLFNPKNIFTVGYPYLEEIKKSKPLEKKEIFYFISNFDYIVLISSQWNFADQIAQFILKVSKALQDKKMNIGLILKPHPKDNKKYDYLSNYKNILLANKHSSVYELFKLVQIHSTIYSTTGIESLAFGKPNIFLNFDTNIKEIFNIVDNKSAFTASNALEYLERLKMITSDYQTISNYSKKRGEDFFKNNVKDNFKEFLDNTCIIKK